MYSLNEDSYISVPISIVYIPLCLIFTCASVGSDSGLAMIKGKVFTQNDDNTFYWAYVGGGRHQASVG